MVRVEINLDNNKAKYFILYTKTPSKTPKSK